MDIVELTINGKKYEVGKNIKVSSDVKLLDFLRHYLNLRGTKYNCRQGGCGACIVAAVKVPGQKIMAVNSCLVPIASCNGWEITTVEGLGSIAKGPHLIQKTLAKFYGTQCGYCSPGMVMNMYSLLMSKGKTLTMREIERSFGSNICRCTGYRPIIDAFKTFAIDAPKSDEIPDIEDLRAECSRKCSGKSEGQCSEECIEREWCLVTENDVVDEPLETKMELKDGRTWISVQTLRDLIRLVLFKASDTYMLIAGNTSQALFPKEYPKMMLDITPLKELKGFSFSQNLNIGAGNTISETMEILLANVDQDYFGYLQKIHDHFEKIANISVRNVGTLAGNLMMKHDNVNFESDLYFLFDLIGAEITILSFNLRKEVVTMQKFLELNMQRKIIISVNFPPITDDVKFYTIKVTPRAQGPHSVIQAGFRFKLGKSDRVLDARIRYGGLSPTLNRPTKTENFLKNKDLFSNSTLQESITLLQSELIVTDFKLNYSVEYRQRLAVSTYYKCLLNLCPKHRIGKQYQSGAAQLLDLRPVSQASQEYYEDQNVWPLNKAIEKVEAQKQCTGELIYCEDTPTITDELYAAFVLSEVATGEILSIDASEVLKKPGIIGVLTADDILGINSFIPADSPYYAANAEVLCDGKVKYYHQPLAMVVAESNFIAQKYAKSVKVTYKEGNKPVLNVQEAKNDPKRITEYIAAKAKEEGNDVYKTVKGKFTAYWQYHMPMETVTCGTRKIGDILEVSCCTQWPHSVHVMVARATKIPQNRIIVRSTPLGGGFGLKISFTTATAVACSIVTQKYNKPCRIIQTLEHNMLATGKRLPFTSEYEAKVNKSGAIQKLSCNFYMDNGYMFNERVYLYTMDMYNNCYDVTRWNFHGFNALTDTAKNTWCRSPGTLESIANTENIIEHIAHELGIDSIEVRLANLNKKEYGALIDMIADIKKSADYVTRRADVDQFNTENKWVKRGLKMATIRWTPAGGPSLNCIVSAYPDDGSVTITHGGVEMGQGMNTKLIQACANYLDIPTENINVINTDSVTHPNSDITGGSITTQNLIMALESCCDELKDNLAPIIAQKGNLPWKELLMNAFLAGINLQAYGRVRATETLYPHIFGIALCETEVDILTGQRSILRVDILQDAGRSINPRIDIGQVEGGFIMGTGYWTSEKFTFKPTGENLTKSTFDYAVPQFLDIPQNFVVTLTKNSFSNQKILGAKGIGECPACLSFVVLTSLRDAVLCARENSSELEKWPAIDGPATVESLYLLANPNPKHFVFQ